MFQVNTAVTFPNQRDGYKQRTRPVSLTILDTPEDRIAEVENNEERERVPHVSFGEAYDERTLQQVFL